MVKQTILSDFGFSKPKNKKFYCPTCKLLQTSTYKLILCPRCYKKIFEIQKR